MVRTIYFPDDSREVILGDKETDLQRIIAERLGRDAEELYLEVLKDIREEQEAREEMTGEDWEKIADSHYQELVSAVQHLDEILTTFTLPRLDRNKVYRRLKDLRDSINKNL